MDTKVSKEELQAAICRGLQNTNLYCPHTTKALCGASGDCAYCANIAKEVEEVINGKPC